MTIYLNETTDEDQNLFFFTISMELRTPTRFQMVVIDSQPLSESADDGKLARRMVKLAQDIAELNGLKAVIQIDPEDYF